MTPETTYPSYSYRPANQAIGERAAARVGDIVELNACPDLTRITVKTQHSFYDIVVITGDTGEVMVRGGSLFPEFRHAIVTASLFSGIAVLPRSIAVGLNLEFLVDGASVITSRVRAISQLNPPVVEGGA